MFKIGEKTRFLLVNMVKGLAWLALLVFLFIFVKNNLNINFEDWLGPVFDNTLLVLSIYSLSELIMGIFPPELFTGTSASSLSKNMHFVPLHFRYILHIAELAYNCLELPEYDHPLSICPKSLLLGKYHSLATKISVFLDSVAALTPVLFSHCSSLLDPCIIP
ncbi:MAG: hypothetical protein R2750_00580 [Bacteroidales bacterium]